MRKEGGNAQGKLNLQAIFWTKNWICFDQGGKRTRLGLKIRKIITGDGRPIGLQRHRFWEKRVLRAVTAVQEP